MKSSPSLKVAFTYLSLFSLVLLAGLLFGQVHIARTQAEATAAHTARYQSYLLADELRQSSDDLTRLARTYVVTGDSKYERQYLDILDIRNGKKPRPQHYERIYWDFVAAGESQPSPQGETASLDALMKQAGFSEQEFVKLKQAQGISDALVKTEVIAMNAVKGRFDDGTGQFSRQGEPDLELARRLMHDDNYHKNKANIMKPVNEFLALLDERTGSAVAEAERLSHQAYLLMLLLQVVSVGVSLGALYLVYRFLMNTLGGEPRVAASVARQIAAGDLTVAVRLAPGDRTSLLFAMKTMRDSLATIVGQVRGGTDTIVSAATQISSGNLDLSQRSEAQASNVEETAASMEELTGTVRQNAENARQANQLAASASEVARQGGAVVTAVVDTMSSIDGSSKKIVDIIAVIDAIAFQTNILALNAAVEAARAGEQGRGFAVVAGEVRNLAQRSAAAAREIKTLIDDSVQQVERGASLVGEAGDTMRAIVGSVASVTDIMAEISAASGEQTAGIEQINAAIIQMDQATQQNAVLVEQAAAATSSLQEQAAALLELVSVFKLDGVTAGAPRLALAPSAARSIGVAATPAGARARRA